jgi:AcrR family transcriptional regulator
MTVMPADDPRARRTRASLRAAALHLAGAQDPATLTISAVASQAGVNRATVYLHYPDLDALLADAMEEAVGTIAGAAQLCPLDAPPGSTPAALMDLFVHVEAHSTLYARMLGPQGSSRFAARLREALGEALLERSRGGPRPDGVPRGVHPPNLAGAQVGVIAHSVTNGPGSAAATATATWRLLARS